MLSLCMSWLLEPSGEVAVMAPRDAMHVPMFQPNTPKVWSLDTYFPDVAIPVVTYAWVFG